MRLGIVVPALNEEASVGSVVERIFRSAEPLGSFRVVVCDNHSSDGTAEAALNAGAEVVETKTRGYGSACLRAIEELDDWPDVLVFMEADGSSRPEELVSLIEPIQTGWADLVLGSRPFSPAMTLVQRWGTRLAVSLVNLRWRSSFRDMGPFRCIKLDTYRRLGMRDRTWGWTIEMQILSVLEGVRILEVPVAWEHRIAGRSKISGTLLGVLRAGTRILWTVGKYSLRRRRDRAVNSRIHHQGTKSTKES
jgi:glycosyltransferase involved in cell wall biosynthesis